MSPRRVGRWICKNPFGAIFLTYVGIVWFAFSAALLWTLVDLTLRHQLAGAACFFIMMTIAPVSMLIVAAVGLAAIMLLLAPIELISERSPKRRWQALRSMAVSLAILSALLLTGFGHRAVSEQCIALVKSDPEQNEYSPQLPK